jgi:hypothetical protein
MCRAKRGEHRVALAVHDDPVDGFDRTSQQHTVAIEHIRPSVPEPLHDLGGRLDIREQQRHGPAGQVGHATNLVDRQATFAGFRRLQPVALLCPRSRRYNQVSALPASVHCSGFARRRHQQRCLTTH